MDPNATLERLRRAVYEYGELDPHSADYDSEHEAEICLAMWEAARDLDRWLSKGGFLPTDWARSADDDLLDNIALGNREALTAAGLESGWDDHPSFPRADWAAEVANGDTWLGYPQWVAAHEFDSAE